MATQALITFRTSSFKSNSIYHYHHISIRNFAKRGIYRGRKRKLRFSKPGLPRGDKPKIDISKTRGLTGNPWGPPRYPIPRVQETSVEFAQNLNSLSRIVQHKLQCANITVSSYNHASKAAMERLHNYSNEIASCTAYLHLYQLIIVDDILGYSRDIGSRNTLWIPSDFTVKELIKFFKQECISDPKLSEIRRIDSYLNPFQPNNWQTIDILDELDGTFAVNNNYSQSRRDPVPVNEYREVEPTELLKIREKARNSVISEEEFIDSSNFYKYWYVPNKEEISSPQGISDIVPDYALKEKSYDNQIETKSWIQQIDDVEAKLNSKLLQKKEWYLNKMDHIKDNRNIEIGEINKINSLLTDEFDDKSNDPYGQYIEIKYKDNNNQTNVTNKSVNNDNLCNIHFPKKK